MRTQKQGGFTSFGHLDGAFQQGRQIKEGASLSGNERDSLYLNVGGKEFANISGISGLDDPGDGRSFAVLDYDRDGWPDLVVASATAPSLQLYRNRIGNRTSGEVRKNGMLAVRFVGGNHTTEPTTSWSNRDGYGARVTVDLDGLSLVREHRAGEGLAAQNSATLLMGIGERRGARSLVVRWPSGKRQDAGSVPANTLVTVYENPAHSPTGSAFVLEPYRVPAAGRPRDALASAGASPARLSPPIGNGGEPTPKLVLYTTVATWCAACVTELPQMAHLRTVFPPDVLAMYGVPYDEAEGPDKLGAWAATHRPAYRLLADMARERAESVKGTALDMLKLEAAAATVVTDGSGRVLLARWGPPSISAMRELLRGDGRIR